MRIRGHGDGDGPGTGIPKNQDGALELGIAFSATGFCPVAAALFANFAARRKSLINSSSGQRKLETCKCCSEAISR